MSDLTPLIPRQPAPELVVDLVGGGRFDLAAERPEAFTLVVFYRGLHCPLCAKQVQELEQKRGEFERRGVGVVAISSDTRERAERSKEKWGVERLRLGYGLDLAAARRWGLYVSTGRGEEPSLFTEPGMVLIRPDGTIYAVSVQSMPFARPPLSELISALDFIAGKDYPARGEVTDVSSAKAA
jgi:peroxiredoxin